MNLLLHKLYQLQDDYFYSLKTIARGNGAFTGQKGTKRNRQPTRRHGFIRVNQKTVGSSEMAQITLDGQLIVEESLKAETTNYEVIGADDEVSEKLDQILQEIQKVVQGTISWS